MSKNVTKKVTKKTKANTATEVETVKQIDLSELTLIDLIGLQNALPAIIEQAKQSEKAILQQKIAALAAESGFELSEVFDTTLIAPEKETKKKRKQIGFVKAKYHNPENPEQTWTGKGRKPKWATLHLKEGGDLQDLLINPEIIE